MNSVRDVNITEKAKAVIGTTAYMWSCSVRPTRTKEPAASAPASTTEPVARAEKKPVCLKPSDPYPTWPFTQVEPKSLARWCRVNNKRNDDYEEALI